MSRAFRLGVFIVAALLIFAGAVFWIGKNQLLFQSKYRLNAEFEKVSGLTAGAEVRVSGIQKGTVRRIDLPSRPDQKVRVEMDLDSETRRVIRKDSTAAIKSEGSSGTSSSRSRPEPMMLRPCRITPRWKAPRPWRSRI